MAAKDLFSGHAELYAAFRPTYPEELYNYVFGLVNEKNLAWDCATGNGQVALRLSNDFQRVFASDISTQQIEKAFAAPNINYSVQPAEQTDYPDHCFDLITVAQALHWIDLDRFYDEVMRVGKTGAVIAVWGYSNISVDENIDRYINYLYRDLVGQYWDHARRLVEEEYAALPFPFREITQPKFIISANWTLKHLSGYLQSWSATQAYIRETGDDPVPDIIKNIARHWGDALEKNVRFPVFTKIGKIG